MTVLAAPVGPADGQVTAPSGAGDGISTSNDTEIGHLRIRTWWHSLGRPATARRIPGTAVVAFVALLVGTVASAVSTATGANLLYQDALSHLTIARRILDSSVPGIEQLGTVWLPAPHLLLMPLTAITWLWQTGLAGAILGTGCLVVSTTCLYRIAARVGLHRTGRLVVVLALLANPSLLYTFTTALTEPVLIAALLSTVSGLARWATIRRTPSAGELAVFAGVPCAIAVLSRYEGWAMVLGGALYIAVLALRRGKGARYAIRMAGAFTMIPALAIACWLTYNLTLYGNPLEFMTGSYSARAQYDQLAAAGLLTTKGSIGMTTWVFDWAIAEVAGVVVLVMALIGAAAAIVRFGVSEKLLIIGLLAVPYVFGMVSLYFGQSGIYNDHSQPISWWNNRFALSTLPLLALLCGVAIDSVRTLMGRARGAALLLALAIVGQNAWWAGDLDKRSPILAEAELSRVASAGAVSAAQYLGAHYDGGGILLDESARYNALLPLIGVPVAEFDLRADGAEFDAALANPAAHDRWLLATLPDRATDYDSGPADRVSQMLLSYPQYRSRYRLVFEAGDHAVYQRIGDR